jgi:hypothetical protein
MDISLQSEKSTFLYLSLLYSPSSAHQVLDEMLIQEVLFCTYVHEVKKVLEQHILADIWMLSQIFDYILFISRCPLEKPVMLLFKEAIPVNRSFGSIHKPGSLRMQAWYL